MREKEITIRDYRLGFFPKPVSHYQSAESILAGFSLILKMAEQLSAEDFIEEFIDFLTSIVERTASVYRASDHVGLEICARKLEEHTRIPYPRKMLCSWTRHSTFTVPLSPPIQLNVGGNLESIKF